MNILTVLRRRKTVILSTVLLALGTFFIFKACGKSAEFDTVRKMDIAETVYALGTVTARNVYNLKIGISTSIRELYIHEGDSIKKNARLLSLAGLPDMYSPISGTITYICCNKGESVFPQIKILTITNLKDRYITLSLEEQSAVKVKPGQKAILSLESLGKISIPGIVQTVFPSEGQFTAHLIVNELPPEILPGMTADVAIETAFRKDAMVVRADAVKSGQVILKKNGTKKSIQVQTGISTPDHIEIISREITLGDTLFIVK